jgi:hypothetical protein
VHTIAYAFPNVKIVTSAVDPEINEKFHVLPGMGNFGDRWDILGTSGEHFVIIRETWRKSSRRNFRKGETFLTS